MILRRLDQSEHGKTRSLWEEVFQEDTKAFLDYYYYIKTRDNDIYVVEEDGGICSMLQLNPYRLKIGEREADSAYIIAVSTRKPYRGRGYMRELLCKSLHDMYTAKMPFTFLMPAAEAIYAPYDFRFIYEQAAGWADVSETTEGKCTSSDAALWQAEEIADFFCDNFACGWQIHAVRDVGYYQTMILEQASEKGGVRLIRDGERLAGVYAYAAEDGLEIREPLYLPGYEKEFLWSLKELSAIVKHSGKIRIYACPAAIAQEKKPVIMARLVRLEEFFRLLSVPEDAEMDCSFAVIDPIIRQNSRVWRLSSSLGETAVRVRETEDSQGVLPVAELTELLFGRASAEEIAGRDGVILTERLAEELERITKFTKVFLNEVV